MWKVEFGEIGRPGEPNTIGRGGQQAASRQEAERIGAAYLISRHVGAETAKMMAHHAGYSWIDDFPTRSSIRIFEQD